MPPVFEARSGGFYLAFDGSQLTISGMGSAGGGTKVIPLASIRSLDFRGDHLVVVFQGGMHAHSLTPAERPQFEALVAAVNSAHGLGA